MPGNEVGDRIHNFFGQENLSHGQHQSEVVDGTWPVLGNNLWAGNQRQIGTPFSNLKNHSLRQPADLERGHGGQSPSVQHGMDFSQSILRPEFARSQSQNRQPTLNGHVHGNQAFHTRQNDSNLLGVDSEPDQCNLTSRGISILDAQLGSGSELHKKNSVTLDFNESPVNFDFLGGGQQQMSSQHPGMLQSLSRQQSGIRDMQLLQQQVMLKQMQEIQRQQQHQKQHFQQQEAGHLNSVTQVSSFSKQAGSCHPSTLVNGIPIHDATSCFWQPEIMKANTNWLQCGMSEAMQGSSSGLMFPPEHGRALPLTGMIPQQVDQSLYGIPVSGTRVAPSQYSPVQMDKSTIQQISGNGNAFSGNQSTGFPDLASMQDNTLASRQGYQGKNMIGTAASQGLAGEFNFENLQQVDPQQRNGPGQDFHGRLDVGGPSETSSEKTAMQITSSQNVATLDPTEERILFGEDDNLWQSFGRGTNIGAGGLNMLDGTDFLGAFPSMQSGSWSALMQSAVAETSSADTGLQEEWRGLTFRGNEPPAENQLTPTVNDGGKQQSTGVDTKLQAASVPNGRPHNMCDGANSSIDYSNMPGVKQSGINTSHEWREKLHAGSSQRYVQPFSGEGTKWLDCTHLQKPVSEGSHNYEKGAQTSDAGSNAKNISGSWTNQLSISSYNTGNQPGAKPNGWNFVDSAGANTGFVLKNQVNENTLQASQSTEWKNPMLVGYGAGTWKTGSVSDSIAESEHSKSTTGSPQVNTEDSNLNDIAALPDSSALRAKRESSQQLANGKNIDLWKHVGSSANRKEREVPGKYQPHMDRSHQNFVSTGNNNLGIGRVETQDLSGTKESKTVSFHNVSNHTSASGVRENSLLDANDSLTFSGGKLTPSLNVGRKPLGVRKFQYHPMGDLDADVEPSFGTKHITHPQSMPMQVSQGFKLHDHGGIWNSKFPIQIARNSVEIDKLHFPRQGETKGLDEISSKDMLPVSASSAPTSFDRAVLNYAASKATTSSQNMLELLHKVDQSREHGIATQHDVKNPNGSVHLRKNQASASQGFGLQLAPPSQPLPTQEHALSSQSPSLTNNCLSSTRVTSEVGDKGHGWLASTSSVQGLPYETSQGEVRENISATSGPTSKNALGKFSAALSPGFPYSKSHIHNMHLYAMGSHARSIQSINAYFDGSASQSKQMTESFQRAHSGQSAVASVPETSRITSHDDVTSSTEMHELSDNKQNSKEDSAQQFPVLEAVPASQGANISGTSQENASAARMSATEWTSVSTRQRSFDAQAFKASPNIQSNNDSEITSSAPQKLEGHGVDMVGNDPSGACSANLCGFVGKEKVTRGDPCQLVSLDNNRVQKTMSLSEGKKSVANCLTGPSLVNPASTQREIEAFGRSLRPNNILHQNYLLRHQVQGMENEDVDLDNRSLKRFKGPDVAVDTRQIGPGGNQFYRHNMVRDGSTNCASSPSGDSKTASFSERHSDDSDTNMPSQDMLGLGQNDTQNFVNSNGVPVRTEQSQISPQMASSWLDQYGTDGQILPIHDAQKNASMKTLDLELPCAIGRPSNSLHASGPVEQENVIAADAGKHGLLQKGSTTSPLANENISSPQLTHHDAAGVSLAAVRPKKRKTATSELVPWHKHVVHGLQRLLSISSAEGDWSLATNRMTEKLEDESEMVEDLPPAFRSRTRLILTTQLMQLLFHPPLASILSTDAMSQYESVVHFLARSTLGDICSTLACAGSDTPVPSSSGNLLPVKLKASETISKQYFSKVVEDLISRARKLENDILRLDKGASVLDLRVECQELEKFSVINRFAKFHGRGQADGAGTSSSSGAPQKSCLQRYVTALPMPRNLPDRVQCFSL